MLLTYSEFDAVILLGEFIAVTEQKVSSPDVDVRANLQVARLVEFLTDRPDLTTTRPTRNPSNSSYVIVPYMRSKRFLSLSKTSGF